MALERLTEREQEVVRQAMSAVLYGPYLDNFEFQTRLGLDRTRLRDVFAAWPRLEDADADGDAKLAINNCLNEVLHGVYISPKEWAAWFTVPREDVQEVYEQWARLRGYGSTGIR